MAAIFQIRRGGSSNTSSLQDGELYLNTNEGALQVGTPTAGAPIKLLSLNTASFGDIILTGSAYISGNIVLGGTITIGDTTNDSVIFNADLSSSIIPDATNIYDLGSTSKVYRNIYATSFSGSFSGSINGINEGITTFSTSVDSRLDQLQLASASLQLFTSSQESKNLTLVTYTGSVNSRLDRLQESTASLNTFSSSQETKNIVIGAYTASINSFISSQETKDIVIGAYTSSMNTFTSSTNSRLGEIESYTSSLKTAIDVTGGNTRIIGNLIVDGTQTSLNVNNVYVEDKLITLSSGSATSLLSDGSGFEIAGANVSMSWEHTNTRFVINTNLGVVGSISSSTIVGLNNVSVTTYSTSVDSRLSNLQSKSASVDISISTLNTFTSSNSNTALNLYTASANTWSGSIDTKFITLASYTASVNQTTSSLNQFSASVTSSLISIYQTTSSLNQTTASLNSFSGNINTKFDNLQTYTTSVDTRFATLGTYTGSINQHTSSLNIFTASINSFTASMTASFVALSASVAYINGGVDFNALFLAIQATTSSLSAATSSYETKGRGIVSGSSQLGNYVATITGTSNQVLVAGSGVNNAAITLTTPQDIASTSNVRFNSLGIGMAASATAGRIDASGDVVAYSTSDERLKENIQPIQNALSKVETISGNEYNWKEEFENVHGFKGKDVGVIAQEIQKILPQAVIERENGYLGVNYEKIIPLLIQSIKELSAKIKELENK